ncbi:hypothetical protein AHAS_Ahas05G0270100 [Arachis hypogaea]
MNRTQSHNKMWQGIWEWKGLQRAKIFVWQLTHGGILTVARTAKWRRGNNQKCLYCDSDIDIPIHVIRDCPRASIVWTLLLNPQRVGEFFNLGLQDWILANLSQHFEEELSLEDQRDEKQKWVKLNTDGASRGNPGPASCAGVFRDRLGAKRKGIPKLIVESDSQEAIELVRNPPKFYPSLTRPIRKIVALLAEN